MTSWLWIFGWFLAVSAFLPALLLLGIGVVTGYQWIAVTLYEVWLRRCARRFEDVSVEVMIEQTRRQIESDPELQSIVLIDEIEHFLRESQP